MNMLHVLFSFQGRIRRLQWWLGSLIAIGITIAVVMVFVFSVFAAYGGSEAVPQEVTPVLGAAVIAFYGVLIWMQLALSTKRYHDRDKSGWWVLVGIIPFGSIWVLIELGFLDGTQGPNRFGASPKGIRGMPDRELGSVFS